MSHYVTGQVSYQVDYKATGISDSSNNNDARNQMADLAGMQLWLLYTLHQNGSLDGMIAAAKDGRPMSDQTWDYLVNPVHGDQKASKVHSRVYDSYGNTHDYVRGGLSVFIGGDEIGPLLLVAPGDCNAMVKDTNLDPDEAAALKILRGVYQKTGSRELAETALQNYYRLNDADQKYVLEKLYSPNARLEGEWSEFSGDDNDICNTHIEYDDMYDWQEKDAANIRWLLCYMPPETAEQLGKSETGVLSQINNPNIGTNLAGDFLTTEQSNELKTIGDLFKNSGTELINLNQTHGDNLWGIIETYAEANFGFEAHYSGQTDSPTATDLMDKLSVDTATQKQLVQLQQLLGATSLTAAQKQKVFVYFASNGAEADTTGANEIELNQALNAFMNDPVMDSEAKTWMGSTFALANVQSGDTKSAWELRAQAGAASPAVSSTDAQTIEASSTLGDPMIPPSGEPSVNASSVLYSTLTKNAGGAETADDYQAELDAASNMIYNGSWLDPADPAPGTVPAAAEIQMDADGLSPADQVSVAKIYDIVSASSVIPEDRKAEFFSYILTAGQEPPRTSEMDQLYQSLKTDPSLTTTQKDFLTNLHHQFYQPDHIEGSYVTDQVWDGFSVNSEDFDAPYTQVTFTKDTAKTALENLGDIGLTSEEVDALAGRMNDASLSPEDITLLQSHLKDASLQPDDRNVIASAIHNSDGTVPIPNSVDKGFKDADIDAAFADLDFDGSGYTQEQIALLKSAAKVGTMTPDQFGFLFRSASQKGLSVKDKVTLLAACDYSHRTAKAAHGAQWDLEVKNKSDDNWDKVYGDPYEAAMSPESCADSGMSSDDTQDLGTLYFQVMVNRLQALDSTVRTYAETVRAKNKQISTMNNAIAAVPPQPASDQDTVPLDSITFKNADNQPVNLLDYLNQQNIKLPTADGSTSLNATQLSSLRQTMSNRATSWGSDSTMAASNFQNAYGKYNTCLSQISSFMPKWYEMLTKAFTGR